MQVEAVDRGAGGAVRVERRPAHRHDRQGQAGGRDHGVKLEVSTLPPSTVVELLSVQ